MALRRRPPGGISSLVELLFAEVVELMAPAVWPAPAAAFVLVESVGRNSRRRWRSGGGRDRRATGTIDQGRPNSATTMVGAWLCSLRAFALNDQQKTTTVYFNRCPYARAREASGGNNSDRPARPAGAGGVALRRRPPGGISSLVELLFAEVVELMAPAVWPAPAAAFVLVESVARDSRRRWRSGGDRRC